MRILFIASDFPTPAEPGRGPFNLALVRALRKRHEVRVIAPIPWTKWSRRADGHESHVAHPTYFYPPRILRSRYDWFYSVSIRSALKRAIAEHQPELVLAYWAHPDGSAAVDAAKRCGAASAVIVGGSDVLLITRDRARRRRVLDTLSSAGAVLTVSEHLRAATVALGVNPRSVHAWSQGVDRQLFAPGDRDATRRALGIDLSTRMLLWVGRMVPVKGLNVLLEAMARIGRGDVMLYLAGEGEYRAALQQQVRVLGLSKAVRFIGPRSPAQLGDWYRAADVTVLPSFSEGLPNVLRESLACGTPFVGTDVGGVCEIARPAIDRLVPPGDASTLGRAIAQMLDAPPVRDAVAFPTWEAAAENLLDLVRPAMNRVPAAPDMLAPVAV